MMSTAGSFNKIFGIGLSKTGTTSLAKALQVLGIRTIDYPHDPRTLEQLERGDYRLDILERHDAVTDTPVVPYFAQLDTLYPGSKFVLTVRDKESWLKSAEGHWKFRESWCRQNETFRNFSYFILTAVYGCVDFAADRFSYVYDRHLSEVRRHFSSRPGDLLEMDICAGDGWEKLCPFLGLEEPQARFPHANTKSEKIDRRRWIAQLDAIQESLTEVVTPGSTIILLDEDKLAASTIHQNWNCLPMVERHGRYWGPPEDSEHAVSELRRLVGLGATHIVVAWPAFWWLDHYEGLAKELATQARLLERDECLVFDLRDMTCTGGEESARASRAGTRSAQQAVRDAMSRAADVDIGDLAERIRRDRWTPPCDMIQLLMALVHEMQPHHIVEFGAGLSSCALVRAANASGQPVRISSIDHDPVYGCEAFDQAQVEARSNVHFAGQIAPLVARPYYGIPMATYLIDRDRLAGDQPFDLAIVDGPPVPLGGRGATLYQLIAMARPGAIVVFDDAARHEEQRYLSNWLDTLGPAVAVHGEAAGGRAAVIEIRQPISAELLWDHRLGLAAYAIAACVPANKKLTLLDDNQWDKKLMGDWCLIEFHVTRGDDAGPPASDEQAVDDLLGLQRIGVEYLAIGWPARWWRTAYPRLWQHLQRRATLLVDNANVTVFRLPANMEQVG